jgi:hypothetical protein
MLQSEALLLEMFLLGYDIACPKLVSQGSISQRARTSPNLGLVLGDIKNIWVVLS